ncbi:metallophosphoesterase [Actinoplanes sichuanensis]|uniref:Metallophosphoesterase family protein n=1 Tax=Actinoplanes sichuanensis TaxID=512349 RepID=A0ABW4ATG9_9ACTN|nr:metallophosphoesterase [Actinoplanes sichuanensis]BEL04663.1 metallophosphoesterase [Actinoplanes sichuanensis]
MATHRILHLSDPHVTGSGFDEDGVDAAGALDRILHDARFVPDLDLVLVTGDIADDGSAEGCAAVLRRVGAFARERGIPHVYTTGNHDAREPFAKVFGSAHLGPDGADLGSPGPQRAAVSAVSGLRIITLDSLVPGSVHGFVDEEQLAWLGGLLERPAPAGSVVALHHPPIVTGASPSMARVNLQNGERLAEVLAGSDVRAVLCGHYHSQLSGFLSGIPVWVTPGVVTRIDLTAPPHLVRGVLGAGATVVDLGGPFSPVFHTLHARDPRAGEQVYLVDTGSGRDVSAEE